MTSVSFPQIIRKAERLPNGRIKGVSPPVLYPRVLKHLTTEQVAVLQGIHFQKMELNKKMWKLLDGWGLDPRRPYRINGNGDVVEIGQHTPKY